MLVSIHTVEAIECLHSDIRRGRAWLRLSLESKALSDSLQQLFRYAPPEARSFIFVYYNI